jgi:Tfp pilus assembly protein PilF
MSHAGGKDVERRAFLAVALTATFIAYLGALRFGFVFDDHSQIISNASVHSWRYVPRYFMGHVWSYQYPHLLANYYRPLFLLWLRLNHALFGLAPWKWHLVCVLLHVGATWLVYLLAMCILRDPWTAGVAALIFGVHPVHVEAVAYISAVPEMLSALMLLSSFLLHAKHCGDKPAARARFWIRPAVSVSLFALAVLAKESALVLPALIAAYDWMFAPGPETSPRKWRPILLRQAPYLAVVTAYLVIRFHALRGFAHIVTPLPILTLVFTAPAVLVFYLRLLVWPLGLSPYYDIPYVTRPGLIDFVLPIVVLVAVGLFVRLWLRRARQHSPLMGQGAESRGVIFALIWLFVPILPVLNLRYLPESEVAHDRYLYLPSIGFAMLMALALNHLRLGRAMFGGRPLVQTGAALALGVLLAASTVIQSSYWADELTLNDRAHRIAPNNVSATTSLAAAAAERGLDSAAIELYRQGLARKPDFWRANVNLAYLYYKLGDLAEAERFFRRAIESDPSDGDQFLYLGLTRMRLGQLRDAEAWVRRALVVRPEGPGYHFALGLVLKAEGELDAALRQFEAELANNPEFPGARAQAAGLAARLRSQTPATKKSAD